jgi:hypothetical protein
MTNQLCRCLDGMEKPDEIDRHLANYWYPVHVSIREPKVKRRG